MTIQHELGGKASQEYGRAVAAYDAAGAAAVNAWFEEQIADSGFQEYLNSVAPAHSEVQA